MESYFTSLSKRQTMLLLTAVTFGGQDSLLSFDFLSEDEGLVLKHRAQEMLQIAREKRVPLLATEIKRLVTIRRGMLSGTDPQKLADVLKGERPAVIEILLRAFPVGVAEQVRELLPPARARFRRDSDIKPEILNLLRRKLEEKLTRDRVGSSFKFSDVIWLQRRELFTLCDYLGGKGLAPAIAGLPDEDRALFINGLPPELKVLIDRNIEGLGTKKLDADDAKDTMLLHEAQSTPAGVLRSAGVQRLARACLAQSAEFAARMLERYPGEFGQLLIQWIREERQRAVNRGDGGRAEIVQELWRLEELGIITKPVRVVQSKKAMPGSSSPSPAGGIPAAGSSNEGHSARPLSGSRALRDGKPLLGPPPSSLAKRDWIAEREARKAGMAPVAQARGATRDPVAERAARRAAAMGFPPPAARVPAGSRQPPLERSVTGPVPQQRKPPPPEHEDEVTSDEPRKTRPPPPPEDMTGVPQRPGASRPDDGRRAKASPATQLPPKPKPHVQGTSMARTPHIDSKALSKLGRGPKGGSD